MLTSLRLDILRDLRQRAGLTQGDMARLCGLHGRQSHQTAGAWERGEMIPNRSRRAKFIGYLWDHLWLGKEPRRFENVWEILVEEWDWEPISDREWATYTYELRPQSIRAMDEEAQYQEVALGMESTISAISANVAESGTMAPSEHLRQIEHTLTLNYDQARPDDARHVLTTWLLTNMSIFRSDRPVWYEVKLHTLT